MSQPKGPASAAGHCMLVGGRGCLRGGRGAQTLINGARHEDPEKKVGPHDGDRGQVAGEGEGTW